MVHTQTQISIATRNDGATIFRKSGGERHENRVVSGSIWLCPAGLDVEEAQSDAPSEFLHLHLFNSQFDLLSDVFGGAPVRASSVGYISGIRDDLILQIGGQILGEMMRPTAAGRVLVDALALGLTARLAQAYATFQGQGPKLIGTSHGLDDRRLNRVLDFMSAHLEDDIGLEDLAAIASLSPFHFSRMFRARTGVSPHRYLSSLRIERSKTMLTLGDASLADIAMAICFSTQGNFSRAFKAATGMTPGEFRRRSR
jgi:AraC family transcriptional regulator